MRALVVDDDMATVDVIVKSIDWESLSVDRVDYCYNIAAAKKYFAEGRIDLAVCDIEMPMGSGLDLLAWAREEGHETEFIFLTSHERFDYASTAIRYNASGYVVKPFRKDAMMRELEAAAQKVRHESETRAALSGDFWRSLLLGQIPAERDSVERELELRRIGLSPDARFCPVLASYGLSDGAEGSGADSAACERELSGLCREAFSEGITEGGAVSYRRDDQGYLCLAVGGRTREEVREACERLCREAGSVLGTDLTCYVGTERFLWELPGQREELEAKDRSNVAAKGRVFLSEEEIASPRQEGGVLDQEKVHLLLQEKKVKDLLDYLKFTMEYLAARKMIDQAALAEIRRCLWQEVGIYLSSRGIETARVFTEPAAAALEERSVSSLPDMMRWQAYLIPRTIAFVRETEKSGSVVERAKNFIREHYRENISRTQVAECVFLNPEYMAKLFKKETGISLKQYISDYRIERAKDLLSVPDVRISDVAEQVGFESFSYFSTVFKKTTGETPLEYSTRITSQN